MFSMASLKLSSVKLMPPFTFTMIFSTIVLFPCAPRPITAAEVSTIAIDLLYARRIFKGCTPESPRKLLRINILAWQKRLAQHAEHFANSLKDRVGAGCVRGSVCE